MYHLKFLNPVEVRMGSPFNVADVELTGEFIPSFEGASFQDKGIISFEGKVCFLIEWKTMPGNRPGFCVWKVSEQGRTVQKSEPIEGCCEKISEIDEGVELLIFNGKGVEKLRVVDFN